MDASPTPLRAQSHLVPLLARGNGRNARTVHLLSLRKDVAALGCDPPCRPGVREQALHRASCCCRRRAPPTVSPSPPFPSLVPATCRHHPCAAWTVGRDCGRGDGSVVCLRLVMVAHRKTGNERPQTAPLFSVAGLRGDIRRAGQGAGAASLAVESGGDPKALHRLAGLLIAP